MKPGLFLVAALLLAGCTSTHRDAAAPAPTLAPPDACAGLQQACLEQEDAQLAGCSVTSFVIDLATPAYQEPPGFTDDPNAPYQQMVVADFARCATLEFGGRTERDVSFAYTGLRVHPPEGSPRGDFAIRDLESATASPLLQAVMAAAGVPVGPGAVAMQDAGGLRTGSVSGAMDYSFTAPFAPTDGSTGRLKEVHYGAAGRWAMDLSCAYHSGTTAVVTTVQQGQLATAAKGGVLVGHGSQPIECTIAVRLGGS